MVGAAGIAHFLFDSDEFRYQRRVYYLRGRSKRQLPHFRLYSQIAARRRSPSPGSTRRKASTMADSCTEASGKRLNELAAMTALHTPHVTPPEQETAWMRAIPKAQVYLPLIVCIVEVTRP
jgi:hypothetical protein